jgi:hypothetical protein
LGAVGVQTPATQSIFLVGWPEMLTPACAGVPSMTAANTNCLLLCMYPLPNVREYFDVVLESGEQ